MIRRTALIAALVAAAFVPVRAQTQTRPHPQHPAGQPHERSSHPPVDPALHAALHARLIGEWSGTLIGADSAETKLHLAIARGKDGQLALKLATDRSLKAGAANEVALDGQGLQWTQALTGRSCKATAAVEAAAHHGTDTMKGTMTCGQQELTFRLQKN